MGKTLILPIVPHLLIIRENKILLFQRTHTGIMDGYYCGPTGAIDPNESPSEAAIREAYEEVGITVSAAKHACTVYFRGQSIKDPKIIYEDICIFFTPVGEIIGTPFNKEPHKHDNFGWYELDNGLPNPIIPTIAKAIELLKDKETYGEIILGT